jgi:hypothetical protein
VIGRRGFLALAGALLVPRFGRAADAIEAMRFSALRPGDPLPEWLKPYAFEGRPRHTQYALVEDAGRTVLRARANASTSGLIRELRADLRSHPLLAWRWKVMTLLERSDIATKQGDDFPARLYVTFDLDIATLPIGERVKLRIARALWGEQVPLAALCYVWDTRAPQDTIAPNAYTDRVQMVVADSGPALLGRWVERMRDVAADYRRAFGLEAPAVNGVVVSADTDNTGETAESWFGDIEFRSRRIS